MANSDVLWFGIRSLNARWGIRSPMPRIAIAPSTALVPCSPWPTKLVGGTVGAGFEYGITPNWSLGVEYDHLFTGGSNVNFADPTGAFLQNEHISQNVDMGLLRLNYRFGGWGSPAVAARY